VAWIKDLLSRVLGTNRRALSPPPTTRRRDDETSPGQSGPDRTVEVDPRSVGKVRMSYSPSTDGDPDPGEIVWTWVPYEENDGRGKDRPVLVVAAEVGGTLLAVQLTSKSHQGADFVPVGAGAWDGEHRPSWVRIDRVLRVHDGGMRREAAALDRKHYDEVATALHTRYGWS
jgi:hypothetical protein